MPPESAAAKDALIRDDFHPDQPCSHVHEAPCHFCGAFPCQAELAVIFGKPACRDRVECYQRVRPVR